MWKRKRGSLCFFNNPSSTSSSIEIKLSFSFVWILKRKICNSIDLRGSMILNKFNNWKLGMTKWTHMHVDIFTLNISTSAPLWYTLHNQHIFYQSLDIFTLNICYTICCFLDPMIDKICARCHTYCPSACWNNLCLHS